MSDSGGRHARQRETTRRDFIRVGAAAGAGLAAAAGGFGTTIEKALAVAAPRRATLDDVEHVVILMQENQSFDHYFGTLRGVRGFSDPNVITQANGKPIWYQLDWATPDHTGYVLPNHLDTSTTSAQWVPTFGNNYWGPAHVALNGGRMDQWITLAQLGVAGEPLANQFLPMSYYARQDMPFQYALADAFTICDGYHCSLLAETNGNRIMGLSGTIDPEGKMGGPAIDDTHRVPFRWTSYPEQLEAAGVSWFVYQEADHDTNNMLPYFAGIANAPQTSQLYQRANSIIPTPAGQPYGPALWAKLRSDVEANQLPQVSYILANQPMSEDGDAGPGYAAYFEQQVLEALTANPDVWRKTVFFLTYDEHGGTFDHVVPPTAPFGTPDEWITEPFATPGQPDYMQTYGPIGLGYRVPMIVVSPFTMGGYVCHETFDHTSMIRFLEAKFGVRCENISAWRRKTVGDMTATLGLYSTAVFNFATLPNGQQLAAEADQQKSLPAPVFPSPQVMPEQEPGTRPVIGPNSGH